MTIQVANGNSASPSPASSPRIAPAAIAKPPISPKVPISPLQRSASSSQIPINRGASPLPVQPPRASSVSRGGLDSPRLASQPVPPSRLKKAHDSDSSEEEEEQESTSGEEESDSEDQEDEDLVATMERAASQTRPPQPAPAYLQKFK
jgi:hypothetical protein